MSAAQALSVARAAGIHIEVEGDDLRLEAPAPSIRPPTASNEPGRRMMRASELCPLQPHQLDSGSYGLDPRFQVRGRRSRARF